MRDKIIKFGLNFPIINNLIFIILNNYKNIKNNCEIQVEDHFNAEKKTMEQTWFIQISAPRNEEYENWGDYYFAKEISTVLLKRGINSQILMRGDKFEAKKGDVYLVIRGLFPSKPVPGLLNVIWVISHPNQVSTKELDSFDFAFAASKKWAIEKSLKSKNPVRILLQATNPDKFKLKDSIKIDDLLSIVFVGNNVKRNRKIVEDVTRLGFQVRIYGAGWKPGTKNQVFVSRNLPNDKLPEVYQNATIVLNDHWPDMKSQDFVSNRIFDVVSCGAVCISDYLPSIHDIFGSAALTYSTDDELIQAINEIVSLDENGYKKIFLIAQQVRQNHSFESRIKEIIKVINQ